jgi:hypothetical protein
MTFKPGESGNPNGRPKRSVEEAALEQFRSHFRNGNMGAVIDSLQRQAARGNVQAIRLVLEYMLGKPPQEVDLNTDGILRVIVEYEHTADKAS